MLPPRDIITRSLGLDVGDKRIGVALSDPGGILASPLIIIERRDDVLDVKAIIDIVVQNEVGQIIIGLPRAMSGRVGQQAEKVQAFAALLCSDTQVPVDFRDERLTTVQAKRSMQVSGSRKTRGRDDAVAATLILQSYLEERQEGIAADN